MAWIIVGFLAGAVAALVFAVTYGGRNKAHAREMFRKSAVLGIYCAAKRNGQHEPEFEDVSAEADWLVRDIWQEEASGE